SSICLFNSPSFRGIQKCGEHKRLDQRHFGSFSDVMATPYFSKLRHGHTCLLNVPSNLVFHSYPNCRSKNRGTQNFKLLHNGL
ncbi:unnamed protein product, partial [Callosobruchus maculatus]